MSSNNWLSPNLSDGLGNRLFQVAAAQAAAIKYNRPLVFFLPRCHKASHCSAATLFKLFPSVPIMEVGTTQWTEISEQAFATYEPLPPTIPVGPIVLKGFRQSPKYFSTDLEIPLDFEAALGKERMKALHLRWISNSRSSGKTAFLHIRLGDYRILPHHQLNLESYWVESLSRLGKKSPRLLVFSDEPSQAIIMAPFFKQFGLRSVEVVEDCDPIESLYLMSLCDGGAVCANSTFSWWGAYLSKTRRDRVSQIFMPSRWGEGLVAPDIYPEWATVIQI
jgi:hypothetical protein